MLCWTAHFSDQPHGKSGTRARGAQNRWRVRNLRDGSSAASMNSAGRALKGNGQPKQWESKERRKEKTYSSMAKYFLRFNRWQG